MAHTSTFRIPAHRQEHFELGLAARKVMARSSHAEWSPPAHRRDPVEILEEQAADRVPDLVPIRYGRMLDTPFAFYRGSAAVMTHDLSHSPNTGLNVQLCGDAHLTNFGLWATPERRLIFGINDFDETLPGPFEWDLKRLAASVALVARSRGFSRTEVRAATIEVGRSYQTHMVEFAGMRELDLWYYSIAAKDVLRRVRNYPVRMWMARQAIDRAHTRDSIRALGKLTGSVDGRRQISSAPPLIVRASPDEEQTVRDEFEDYLSSIPTYRRCLLDRYRFTDAARKVVGVGSVGTRCWIALLEGRDGQDPLILQMKEATRSVLERHLAPSDLGNHGERVVVGQRLTQAASDIFLGWARGRDGRDYYWRQLWDMKGGVNPLIFSAAGLRAYAAMCGWALARAHAKTGDRVAIMGYMGRSDRFPAAIADFGEAYSRQAATDHAALEEAERSGRIQAIRGI